MWSILWVVCLSTDLCAQFNMVSEPQWTRNFSSSDLLLDHFWAKLLLPALHQKHKVCHLIPQVKELLIKLAWSTMLSVMKIPKVQTANLILSVLLCDLQVYHSSSLHSLQASQSPSWHSLQQITLLYCIPNGPSSGAPHSFQLSPVEGGHGDVAMLQKTLQTHNGSRKRSNSLCWQRKVFE